MQTDYSSVPRFSNTFIAQQRDFIDHAEMQQARQLDAVEPATHREWREILRINGELRHAIRMLRIARKNAGKGYQRVEICRGLTESRNWTQEFVTQCQAEVLWFLADKRAAWSYLRRAEAMS